MNIANKYDLRDIIKELETALQIDGTDFELKNMNDFLATVKRRMSIQYNISITDRKVSDPEMEIGPQSTEVALFLDNMKRLHANLSGYCQIVRYHKQNNISLEHINYLGYTKRSVQETFEKLKSEENFPSSEGNIELLKDKIGTIPLCWEKRLLILLIVAHDIGLDEITSCISEILWLSMLS